MGRVDLEGRGNGYRCLGPLCCAFSAAPTLQKGLSLQLWLSLKHPVNCPLWKRALPAVTEELMPTCHSKAGWVWLLFLGSSIAVVLEIYEGSKTTPFSSVRMPWAVWLSLPRMVFFLLGQERPVARHRCWGKSPTQVFV